jgi:hypothetical protein
VTRGTVPVLGQERFGLGLPMGRLSDRCLHFPRGVVVILFTLRHPRGGLAGQPGHRRNLDLVRRYCDDNVVSWDQHRPSYSCQLSSSYCVRHLLGPKTCHTSQARAMSAKLHSSERASQEEQADRKGVHKGQKVSSRSTSISMLEPS